MSWNLIQESKKESRKLYHKLANRGMRLTSALTRERESEQNWSQLIKNFHIKDFKKSAFR